MPEPNEVLTETRGISALDFARMVAPPGASFGLISSEEIIKKIEFIVERMKKNESPKIILQSAHSASCVNNDDFLITTLVLEFAELLPEAKPGTKLYGSGPFPVEVKS
jgi:hypothetical protein